jgi:quercetin dioxygenase-like cupin family protein
MIARRRIVVAHDAEGASVVAEDSMIDAMQLAPRGNELAIIWGENQSAQLPGLMHEPTIEPFLPPPSGWRAAILTFMPDDTPPLPEGAGSSLPDMGAQMAKGGGRGMHTTATIDVSLVVRGELVLELDGGQEIAVSEGDTVVQLGGRHAWRNRSGEPVLLAVFMVGAEHETA